MDGCEQQALAREQRASRAAGGTRLLARKGTARPACVVSSNCRRPSSVHEGARCYMVSFVFICVPSPPTSHAHSGGEVFDERMPPTQVEAAAAFALASHREAACGTEKQHVW